jgi:hypothetical protein
MPDPHAPGSRAANRCDYCGDLEWTVTKYGRVTHKEACPHRSEPWSQTYPQREPATPDRAAKSAKGTTMTIANRPIDARAEKVRELLYAAFLFRDMPPESAAHGARVLGEIIVKTLTEDAPTQ